MAILGNFKDNYDIATTLADKLMGFDPNTIYLVILWRFYRDPPTMIVGIH